MDYPFHDKLFDDEVIVPLTYPMVNEGYLITNYGKVFQIGVAKAKSVIVDKDGYYRVRLQCRDGNRRGIFVHRLVCWEFCEHREGCNVVNHLDGNKQNNYYENLEWTTPKGNTQHAIRMGLMRGKADDNVEQLIINKGYTLTSSVYSRNTIERICEELSKGKTPIEVYHEFYPNECTSAHKKFYYHICKILNGGYQIKISREYTFPESCFSSKTRHKFSDEEINTMRKMIIDGCTNSDILDKLCCVTRPLPYRFRKYRNKIISLRKELNIPSPDTWRERSV